MYFEKYGFSKKIIGWSLISSFCLEIAIIRPNVLKMNSVFIINNDKSIITCTFNIGN